MKLEKSFVRVAPIVVNPGDVVLGTDAIPTDAAYLALTNVFRCPQYGPDAKPINAVALAYDGPLGAPDLTFTMYLWDEFSLEWFEFGTVDIVVGQIKYISLPNVIDRKDTRQVSRIAVAFVSSNPLAPAAGTYTFLTSAVTGVSSLDPSAFAGIVAVLNLILADTTSIDGKLENPMPVIGNVAVGAAAAGDPVLMGGAGTDGNVHYIHTDAAGNIITSGGSVGGGNNIWSNPQDFAPTAVAGTKTITFAGIAPELAAVIDTINFSAAVIKRTSAAGVVDMLPTTSVAYLAGTLTLADMTANFVAGDTVLVFLPGPDKAYDQANDASRVGGTAADDAPAVGNPVYMGARYLADIFASVVSATGDAAGLVTDQFRRLHVRPAGYDSIGDGIRALLASSLAEPQPFDISQTTVIGLGTYDYPLDLDDYKYWTLQWSVTAGTSDKILTVWATDQDDGTAPASCLYQDVTLSWFGAASFSVAGGATGSTVLEIDTPSTWRYVRVRIVVGSVTPGGNDNTWLGFGRKQRM